MRERAPATYQDLLDAPPNKVAELIRGTLIMSPRPAFPAVGAASGLMGVLHAPFGRGRGGPGGWIILVEPEIHFGRDVLVPDLAGWKRDRMPEMPTSVFTEIAPNWACEVLSPSTAAVDRSEKLPIFAAHGVSHVWLIDPLAKTLEVLRLDGATYRAVITHAGEAKVRAEPFDAIELALGELWAR